MKNIFILIFTFLFSLLPAFTEENIKINDYSKIDNWLSFPKEEIYPADVFYIYPSTCISNKENAPDICDINNQEMRENAKKVLNLQAKAFDTAANIYAPFYTQFAIKVFQNKDYQFIQNKIYSNEQEIRDIYNALDYYFVNINKGKPFILASHSQGSTIMMLVLSDYMKKHPQYYKNMVAAYVIGAPVTKEYMKQNPHLKFAKTKNDTGVIISYNAQAPVKTGPDIIFQKNRLVINPINWSTKKNASKNKNLGSLDEKTLKIKTPGIADAKINRKKGIIICSTVNVKKYEIPLPEYFGHGSFHGQEYQLYFLNLRQNAIERIDKFISTKK